MNKKNMVVGEEIRINIGRICIISKILSDI